MVNRKTSTDHSQEREIHYLGAGDDDLTLSLFLADWDGALDIEADANTENHGKDVNVNVSKE